MFEPGDPAFGGLGKAPTEADPDRYRTGLCPWDLVVAGGGIAGLNGAAGCGVGGKVGLVLEQSPISAVARPTDHADGQARVDALVAQLRAMPNVNLRRNTMATGLYDHGYLLARGRWPIDPNAGIPRQRRLWRIRAGHVVVASARWNGR